MDSRKFQFLKAVLGEDGARALAKAAERGPELEAALLPRTIMAWLNVYGRMDFEGRIPGVENTYLQFTKSEDDRYSGSIAVDDEIYSFDGASMYHLGACVAVALGYDHERIDPQLRDLDIQRLGKNIDTLAKARVAIAELQKRVLDPSLGITFSHEHHDLGDGEMLTHVRAHSPEGLVVGEALFNHHSNGSIIPEGVMVHPDYRRKGIASAIYGHAQKVTGKIVAPSHDQTSAGAALWAGNARQPQFGLQKKAPGAEPPGSAHAPTPPEAPTAPTPPDPTQNSKGPVVSLRPKPPKPPQPKASTDTVMTGPGQKQPKLKPAGQTLKVTKSQAERECRVCGGKQFQADKFRGCICFRDLAKSVKVTALDDGYNLEFSADWDSDSILTLAEALGKR